MDKYIDKQYLIANLKAFKNQILDPKYASLGEDGKISKAVVPSLSASEVGALPEDTEIPIFTNKAVLDKISEEKVESWDEATTTAHTHNNKAILDKFTESDEGEVLYKGKQIASGNLWSGTKEEFDAIEDKDPDTTYVITDDKNEELSFSDLVIDDTSNVAIDKTWSVNKIRKSTIPYILIDTTKDIDFNEYVETGYYTPNKSFSTGWFTYNILHAPTEGWLPAGGFALEVKTFDNTGNVKWFTQILYSYVGTDNNSAPIYTRTFFYDGSKTTFSPWKRMADIDDSKISSEETWSSKRINEKISNGCIPMTAFDLSADIDLNDYTKTGYYFLNADTSSSVFTHSLLNFPYESIPAGGFGLDVRSFGTGLKWCVQTVYIYSSDYADIWCRTRYFSSYTETWGAWKKVTLATS